MSFASLVLAAGAGRRLQSPDRPKVLAEVGGRPLLVRLLSQLVRLGTDAVTIAVGAHADQVRAAVLAMSLPVPVRFVENTVFGETNNSFTLHLCADALKLGCLLIEGDVAADDEVLRALIDTGAPNAWGVRSPGAITDGAFLQAGDDGLIHSLQIVREGPPPAAAFKSTGILKLSPEFGARFVQWLDTEVHVRRDRYYDLVLSDHLGEAALAMVVADAGRWIEVDSPVDLALANRLFAAPVERGT